VFKEQQFNKKEKKEKKEKQPRDRQEDYINIKGILK
jgi:hypothetical protein